MKIKKYILSIAILSLLPGTLALAQISGVVFEDENANGVRDSGEKGIRNVIVSNQHEVTTTNRRGQYNLPVHDEMVVFVTKPSGYALPVNENNLPQFYYIHQPEGSPDENYKYKGVEPTGELPETIDFPLIPADEPGTYDVVVFTDPQPTDHQDVSFIRDDVVAELVDSDAAFGIVLGDIMNDDLSLFDRYNSIIAKIGIPFFNVPGNHDMNYRSPNDTYSLETYKRHFGPPYYAFEYGDVHFVVLDDVVWYNPEDDDEYYEGGLGETQLTWLESHLKEVDDDKLVVVNVHIPLVSHADGDHEMNMQDGEQLWEILGSREKLLALAGHYHMVEHSEIDTDYDWTDHAPFEHMTLSAVSGSWWIGPEDERGIPITDQRDGTPNGYHIFTFDGNEYSQYLKPAKFSKDFQMRISQPRGILTSSELAELPLVVNVFNANGNWDVQYKMNDGEYQPLKQVTMMDPYIQRIYTEMEEFAESWVEPRPSTHMFTAELPSNLGEGVHAITVKAADEYGIVYKASRIIEIE